MTEKALMGTVERHTKAYEKETKINIITELNLPIHYENKMKFVGDVLHIPSEVYDLLSGGHKKKLKDFMLRGFKIQLTIL